MDLTCDSIILDRLNMELDCASQVEDLLRRRFLEEFKRKGIKTEVEFKNFRHDWSVSLINLHHKIVSSTMSSQLEEMLNQIKQSSLEDDCGGRIIDNEENEFDEEELQLSSSSSSNEEEDQGSVLRRTASYPTLETKKKEVDYDRPTVLWSRLELRQLIQKKSEEKSKRLGQFVGKLEAHRKRKIGKIVKNTTAYHIEEKVNPSN